ncbi:DUF4833 domain-containing protein [Mucilaginibacter antarcticus]|uniref:DUF4833 domain-containing protein n=1 Tax=Mucilaginibacter antarcticus TaxID=1855725 RepID=UPI00362860B5
MKLSFLLLLTALNWYTPSPKTMAQKPVLTEDKYPVPPPSSNRLFYLQRSSNINTIIYDVNIEDGQIDDAEPLKVYWIRYNEKGQKEDLSYIQRKFAYGLTAKKLADDKFDVRFVSYKKFPMVLMKAKDGKYHIFATVAQKQIILEKLFVKIEGGSFWLPNVVYVEFKGEIKIQAKKL